jgi:hypothetical protein
MAHRDWTLKRSQSVRWALPGVQVALTSLIAPSIHHVPVANEGDFLGPKQLC